MDPVVMLVVAAGRSTRMGCDKQRIEWDGIPVLFRTLQALETVPEVHEIILVARPEDVSEWTRQAEQYGITKLTHVVDGGNTRQQSVTNGLAAVPEDTVLLGIHDGARPLVPVKLVQQVIQKAAETGAAAPAIPVSDTLKRTDKQGFILETVDREGLWRVQTPQVFRFSDFRQAMQQAKEAGADCTDDCRIMERAGHPVALIPGSAVNIKLTTPDDVLLAQAITRTGKEMSPMRIGHGYDVHRLTEGRPLILGGVNVPFEKGLLGHSDADVLTHAVMDALLGAAAAGDIGVLFPDTDDAYAGADSIRLLEQVIGNIRKAGYTVGNIDATVLAQHPKLMPFIPEMRKTLAQACQVPVDRISVKATTEEGLGFTGSGEGIAAHAVCLLEKV